MNIKHLSLFLILAIATSAHTYSSDNQDIRKTLREEAAEAQQAAISLQEDATEEFQSKGRTLKNLIIGASVWEMQMDKAAIIQDSADLLVDICHCMDDHNGYTIDDAYSCHKKLQEHTDHVQQLNPERVKFIYRETRKYLDSVRDKIQTQKK